MLLIERFLNTDILFQITYLVYWLALLFYILSFILYVKQGRARELREGYIESKRVRNKRKNISRISSIFFFLGFLLTLILVVDRWIEAGRPPFRTLYETLIYASFTISLVYVVVERLLKIKILGLLVSALILIIYTYSLTTLDVEIVPVMPALQTPIMIPHVTSYFFAYAGVFIAGLAAALSLVLPEGIRGYWLISEEKQINFREYIYKIVKFAFLFLTFGLALGSWWGQIAWSNFWGWDPKENWALISWLVLASYFHVRFIKSFDEKKLAWLVVGASFTILFTYLGMKYLPKDVQSASLHIYIEE